MNIAQTTPSTPLAGATATLRFSSIMELVPGICQACASFVHGGAPGEAPELILVLRELLSNAIEHGSGNDPAREVSCELTRCGANCALLTVCDGGDGFDANTIDLQWPDQPTEIGAGGLRLVHALSETLHFENGGRRAVCRVSWNLGTGLEKNYGQQQVGNERKEIEL